MENNVSTLERQAHWQNVYQTKGERTVSWFQESCPPRSPPMNLAVDWACRTEKFSRDQQQH
jgi:hypothetical protein